MAVEMHDDKEKSGMLASEYAFLVFAVLVMTEIMCVMALSMYRISPWLLRITGDQGEADRVTAAKKRYGTILQRTTVVATVTRRIVVSMDAGAFSTNLALSLGIALAAFLVPKPKV